MNKSEIMKILSNPIKSGDLRDACGHTIDYSKWSLLDSLLRNPLDGWQGSKSYYNIRALIVEGKVDYARDTEENIWYFIPESKLPGNIVLNDENWHEANRVR